MIELPSGSRTLEDLAIIDTLLRDETYKSSMEEKCGPIKKIWADWPDDRIYYELLDGNIKESVLSKILVKLKEIDYMKEFGH